MNNEIQSKHNTVALAFYPQAKVIGYAIMVGPHHIKESGMHYCSASELNTYIKNIQSTIQFLKPDVIILEDKKSREEHRLTHMQMVFHEIEKMIQQLNYSIIYYSRKAIRDTFGGLNKPEIAKAIAQEFQDYQEKVPKERRFDDAEPLALCEFDAISLAMTHQLHIF